MLASLEYAPRVRVTEPHEMPELPTGIAQSAPMIHLPMRAAQYVRMSTDHQKYSIQNQVDAIASFATSRGYQIVRTYADAGRSGLRLEGRSALKQLLSDVENERTDY